MKRKKIFWILFLIIMCLSSIIYAKYIITEEMQINITTSPFYFFANVDKTEIEYNGNDAYLNLEISNNNGEFYTYSDIQYEISLESKSYQFSIENENVENNILSKTLTGNSLNNVLYNLKFSLNAASKASITENCVLKIKAKAPYVQEISIPITITIVPTNIEVSIDKLIGVFDDENSSSVHVVTVKNNTSIPIVYNISASVSNELQIDGTNQNTLITENGVSTTTLTISPAQDVYFSENCNVEIKTNIVSPFEYEISSNIIEIQTYASKMRTIITQNYTINQTTPNFRENITTENGSGVFQANDANGTAYYFRGIVSNNYVDFANYTWRIMRVNSDGTMRLILDSTIGSKQYGSNNIEYNNSQVEKTIEKWYKNNLSSYNSYINQNVLFIQDRTNAQSSTEVYKGWENIFNANPTINTSGLSYSQKYSINTLGNGFLSYPIALPTADEIMMAGATIMPDATITNANGTETMENNNFYMATGITSDSGIWTMTPFSSSQVICFKPEGGFYTENLKKSLLIKPVIELNADLRYKGNGTITEPYKIYE